MFHQECLYPHGQYGPPSVQSGQLSYSNNSYPLTGDLDFSQSKCQNHDIGVGGAAITEERIYVTQETLGGYSWDSSNNLSSITNSSAAQFRGESYWSEEGDDGVLGQVESPRSYSRNNGNNCPRQERPDDVSTWSLDTIRQVASDLHQSSQSGQPMSDWDTTTLSSQPFQNNTYEVTDSTAAPARLWDNNNSLIPGSEYQSNLELRDNCHPYISGSVPQDHLGPWDSPVPNSDNQGQSRIKTKCGSHGSRGKTKMYQLPPQEDPEEERKRLRAINRREKRQKNGQEEQDLKLCLYQTTTEITRLKQETLWRRQEVELLEYQLANSLTLNTVNQGGPPL